VKRVLHISAIVAPTPDPIRRHHYGCERQSTISTRDVLLYLPLLPGRQVACLSLFPNTAIVRVYNADTAFFSSAARHGLRI